MCARCMGNTLHIDGRPQSEPQVGPDKLEVVASFCYLGDILSVGGGCKLAVISSHIPPPLLQDPWPCIQLLRTEHHVP